MAQSSNEREEPEAEPLLIFREADEERSRASSREHPSGSASRSSSAASGKSVVAAIHWTSLISLAVIIFFYIFSNYMLVIPTLRLYEDAVCRDYYSERDGAELPEIDEELCKIPEVQKRLATLIGWNMGLQAIPGLLTAVWYGSLADRLGRKPVLLAAMAGEFASWAWILAVCYFRHVFPIRAIWASAIFLFIGGGPRVTVSILYASIMDSVPAGRRTQFLYLRAAMSHLASLVAPLIASSVMQRSLSLLFQIVFVLWIVTFAAMFSFKETLKLQDTTSQRFRGVEASGIPYNEWQDAEGGGQSFSEAYSRSTAGKFDAKAFMARVRKSIQEISSDFLSRNLLICFALFFFKRLAFTSENFVFQYASKVLGWTLAKTAWIQFTHSLSAMIATALALPLLNTYFQKYRRIPSVVIDISVARACLLIAIGGFLWIWRARSVGTMISGVFVLGLAEGLEPTIQGLSVSLVDPGITGRLFTLIAAIDQVATLISGPVMGQIFAASQDLVSLWQGLVYVVASVIFAALLGVTFLLRPTRSRAN